MPSSEVIRNNNRLFQYDEKVAPERQSNKEPSWSKRFFRFFNLFFSHNLLCPHPISILRLKITSFNNCVCRIFFAK